MQRVRQATSLSRLLDVYMPSLSKMNRPYGAVDVAANLKGAVPKVAVQKILIALAERGELVQKTYGAPH